MPIIIKAVSLALAQFPEVSWRVGACLGGCARGRWWLSLCVCLRAFVCVRCIVHARASVLRLCLGVPLSAPVPL